MYSKKILNILKKNKLKIGDKVRIILDNKEIKGIIMPRPESGDEDCLIIKLDDGYNIGIKITKEKIEKI
mgnify:CR=1 FL=1